MATLALTGARLPNGIGGDVVAGSLVADGR